MGKAKVKNRFPQFAEGVERRVARAMTEALITIGAEANARAPQDSGTLINSQIRFVRKEGTRIVGTLGYTADYALAVHEAEGKLKGQPRPKENGKARGEFWGPHGEPEFARKGAEAATPRVRQIIKRAIKG